MHCITRQGATTKWSLGDWICAREQALPQIIHPRRSPGVLTPPVCFDESQLRQSGLRLTAAPRCPFCRLVRVESRRARLGRWMTRPEVRPGEVVTRSPWPARIDTGSAHLPAWQMVLSYDRAVIYCPLKNLVLLCSHIIPYKRGLFSGKKKKIISLTSYKRVCVD